VADDQKRVPERMEITPMNNIHALKTIIVSGVAGILAAIVIGYILTYFKNK
jgi:hypothetical protein